MTAPTNTTITGSTSLPRPDALLGPPSGPITRRYTFLDGAETAPVEEGAPIGPARPSGETRRDSGARPRAAPKDWIRGPEPSPLVGGFGTLYRAGDTAAALIGLLSGLVLSNLGDLARAPESFLSIRLSLKNVLLLLGFFAAWRPICVLCGLYEWPRIRERRAELRRVIGAATAGTAVAFVFHVTSVSGAFDTLALALFWVVASLGMLVMRSVSRMLIAAKPRPIREVLIVGSGPRAFEISQRLAADRDVEQRVVGYVDTTTMVAHPKLQGRIVAGLEELETHLMRTAVDEVIVALPLKSYYAEIERVVEICECLGVTVSLPADSLVATTGIRPRRSATMLAVTIGRTQDGVRLAIKRAIDIVGASIALVLFSPIMIAAVAAIRLEGRGPVIYKQERYGYNRRRFKMYKFRTMVLNADELQPSLEHLNEAAGPLFKIKSDPRITRIGRVLRRTSIDELPQFFNVLMGDMSLVGPRPMAIRDVERFPTSWLMRRFSVWPGITGLWQIRGRSQLGYETWAKLDLQYVDEWSLGADFKILALTVPAVLRGTGAE